METSSRLRYFLGIVLVLISNLVIVISSYVIKVTVIWIDLYYVVKVMEIEILGHKHCCCGHGSRQRSFTSSYLCHLDLDQAPELRTTRREQGVAVDTKFNFGQTVLHFLQRGQCNPLGNPVFKRPVPSSGWILCHCVIYTHLLLPV